MFYISNFIYFLRFIFSYLKNFIINNNLFYNAEERLSRKNMNREMFDLVSFTRRKRGLFDKGTG